MITVTLEAELVVQVTAIAIAMIAGGLFLIFLNLLGIYEFMKYPIINIFAVTLPGKNILAGLNPNLSLHSPVPSNHLRLL